MVPNLYTEEVKSHLIWIYLIDDYEINLLNIPTHIPLPTWAKCGQQDK